MKYSCKISRYDAGRLFRLSDKFWCAEKKYREAQKLETKIKDYLFRAQQEMHLADLAMLSAGREMSDILYGILQEHFDEPDD